MQKHKTYAATLAAMAAWMLAPVIVPAAHAATSPSACRTAMKACVDQLEGTSAVCALEAIDDGATTVACISGIASAGTTCNITSLQNSCATSSIYPDNTNNATSASLGNTYTSSTVSSGSLSCANDGRVSAVRSRHDGNRIVALAILCTGNSAWISTDSNLAGKIAEERACRNGQMVGGLKGDETNYSVQSLGVMCTSYSGTTPYNYSLVGTPGSGTAIDTMACGADSYIYGLNYYYQTNLAGTSSFYLLGIKAQCKG